MRSSKRVQVRAQTLLEPYQRRIEPNANQPCSAYVSCSTAADLELIKAEARHIEALSGKGLHSLRVLEQSADLPAGCAVFPVSSAITVYLDVGTQADVSALIEKTQAKLTKLTELADRQRKLVTTEGWADKVSTAVKHAEEEKLSQADAQMRSLASSIEQFRRLELC